MSDHQLIEERDGRVLTLRLNRPETLNSLSEDLLGQLRDRVVAIRDDDTVRAVVLTGEGRAFSSGADLSTHGGHVEVDIRRRLRRFYAPLVCAIHEMEKPVVAAVNGVAAGAGASLAMACDSRVASSEARFVDVFVRRGLIPDAGSTYFLPRLVGPRKAWQLFAGGGSTNAEEALAIGLVDRVVPPEQLRDEVAVMAAELASGPYSLGLIKRALALSARSDLATQLRHEEDLQALAMKSDDYREGVASFKERRPPRFEGR